MTAKQYALDLLFNGLSDIKNAHELSMTYQRDQMVSNRELSLTSDNNPRGITGLTFKANVPAGNVTTLTGTARWFTDPDHKDLAHQGSASDPVKDMRTVVRAMRRKGYRDITVEVDEQSWFEDMDHTAWRTAIGYQLRPDLVLAASNDANALAVGIAADDDAVKSAFSWIRFNDIADPKAPVKEIGMEIERKWLVRRKDVPYDLDALEAYGIEQAYVSFHPTVRVRALRDRQGGERFVLTVKSGSKASDGIAREEFELPIDRTGYETLLAKAEGSVIRKTRYLVHRADGLLEEIDVFRDALGGLCYLEIEFPTVEAARAFESPDWTARDVTSEKSFRNSALA